MKKRRNRTGMLERIYFNRFHIDNTIFPCVIFVVLGSFIKKHVWLIVVLSSGI
jgi:hypothetical protein